MWNNTPAAKILGVQYPILQGPFGGNLSTVDLAATVSNLGGVGGYGAYTLTPGEIIQLNKALRQATDKPYNINLWVSDTDAPGTDASGTGISDDRPGISNDRTGPSDDRTRPSNDRLSDDRFETVKALFRAYFDELGLSLPDKPAPQPSRFEDQAQAILDCSPPVVSFTFGIPSAAILEQCRKKRIRTAGAATTLDEALALEAAGVDLIIASGFEAGGHRPSFLAPAEDSLVGTFVLVQQIRDSVRTPVIAAGGIATGKGIAAALALGADGVQIGTAFLACEESGAPAFHRHLLLSEAARYTVLTRAFSGRLGRGLMNRIGRETAGREKDFLPFPLQSRFMSRLRQEAIEREKWELLYVWGGQIATILKHTKAGELMAALIAGTNTYFDKSF
jgi:nitronate monooxygenase